MKHVELQFLTKYNFPEIVDSASAIRIGRKFDNACQRSWVHCFVHAPIMSSNPASPRTSLNYPETDARTSFESLQSGLASPPITALSNGVNGHTPDDEDPDSTSVEKLKRELEKTREEKEQLATQYRNLLAKLTTMRNTLGNKLKQDAVRLLVQQLL